MLSAHPVITAQLQASLSSVILFNNVQIQFLPVDQQPFNNTISCTLCSAGFIETSDGCQVFLSQLHSEMECYSYSL
jgi:hypothetical protein